MADISQKLANFFYFRGLPNDTYRIQAEFINNLRAFDAKLVGNTFELRWEGWLGKLIRQETLLLGTSLSTNTYDVSAAKVEVIDNITKKKVVRTTDTNGAFIMRTSPGKNIGTVSKNNFYVAGKRSIDIDLLIPEVDDGQTRTIVFQPHINMQIDADYEKIDK